jgi:hypothetical protein
MMQQKVDATASQIPPDRTPRCIEMAVQAVQAVQSTAAAACAELWQDNACMKGATNTADL